MFLLSMVFRFNLIDPSKSNWKKRCQPLSKNLERQVLKGTITADEKIKHDQKDKTSESDF